MAGTLLIISRADASFGCGHLSRMITLGRFMEQERGFKVTKVLLGDELSLTFARTLAETVLFFPSWELTWASRRTFLKELLMEQFPEENPDVVIFDVYDFFDTFWAKGLFRKIFPRSKFIGFEIYHSRTVSERMERKNYEPVTLNLIVNSLLSPFGKWEKKNGIRTLFGTDFLILPPFLRDFPKWRFSKENRRITIFLGSSPSRVLGLLIDELRHWTQMGYDFCLYSSFAREEKKLFGEGIRVMPLTTQECFLRDMVNSHMAIVSASLVLYELAFLGVPAVVIPVVSHQLATAYKFSERNYSQLVLPTKNRFSAQFSKAMEALGDEEKLTAQSFAGRALLDGRGIYRVAEVISEIAGSS